MIRRNVEGTSKIPALSSRLGIQGVFLLIILAAALFVGAAAEKDAPLVEVKSLDSSIIVDIPYATTKNFTGKKLYPANRALLRKPVADALVKVQARLRADKKGLKIWDAYRPLSVQRYMWSLVPDPRYVADPKTGSKHNRGAAVDVTLVDSKGKELEMPTAFDDFSPRASRTWQGASATATKNRQLLEDVMKAEGFIPLPTEWWHFDYGNWREYAVMDVPLAPPGERAPARHSLRGPKRAAKSRVRDGLILHRGKASFQKATLGGAALSSGAVIAAGGASKARITSEWIALTTGVADIIPSWNIACPEGSGWAVQLRLRDSEKNETPWLYLGQGGNSLFDEEKVTKCSFGDVDIDFLKLSKPPARIQYRVHLYGGGAALKLFALAWRTRGDPDMDTFSRNQGKSIRRIPVPFRSQFDEEKSLASRICCPTSTSMVMDYLGVKRPTAQIAARAYCSEHDIYGEWWRPPYIASLHGLRGYVRIFSSWPDVQKEIGRGQPVIASICFGRGELKGSPRPSSTGHIIVITGFDERGRVLVNDPAGRNEKEGVVSYDRRELGRAWFGHRGVGIMLFK